MEIVTALPWELGADLVITAGLLKAGLLVGALWLAVRALPAGRTELRASLWIFGFAALLAVPLVSVNWGRPLLDLQVVSFPQGLFREEGASSPAYWIFLVWAAGAAGLLGRFLLHCLRVRRMARAARPVESPRLLALLEEARERVGVGRPVRLALSPDAGAPLLVGWPRPVILLAPDATEWPEDRLLAVLCHELAHVRRADYPAMVLGELVRALYWVNPLVFFGLREARMEQDKACDAVALRAGFRSAVYARHLVDVARCVRDRAVAPAALTFGRRSDLRNRVGVLLDRGEDAMGRSRGRALTLASGALVVLAAGALAATNFWICTGWR